MKKEINKLIRLVLIVGICVMVIGLLFPTSIGTCINTKDRSEINGINPILLKILASYKLLNWNFWENPPHIFSRNEGNVGIGTIYPLAKLDVTGNIAVNGKEVIDSSGNWVGNTTPITGKWCQNMSTYGSGYYNWNEKIFNSNPAYLYLYGYTFIYVNISGYYQINVNVIQIGIGPFPKGHVELRKNNINISFSESYCVLPDTKISHHFSDIVYLNAGDYIGVYNKDTYCDRGGHSTVSIFRIT